MLKTAQILKVDWIEAQAKRVLVETLRDVPFVKELNVKRNARLGRADIDLLVTLRHGEKRQRIVCEVKSSGQPRLAREACLHLRHVIERNDYPVFMAPYISPEASAICVELGVGFLDFAGNGRLTFGEIYIKRSGYPNPSVARRELRSIYSPKAERVLRVLLTVGPCRWKTQQLADEAQVSLGQISNVKALLTDREWIDSDESGFGLRSFDHAVLPLVKGWSENYRLSRSEATEFYSMNKIPEIEGSLVETANKLGGELGFTLFSGAARFQPIVRYHKVSAYYLGNLSELAIQAGLKPVGTGANVTVFSPYDRGIFYGSRKIDQAPILSPVQLYLDLQQTKGRGEEAAAAILNEVVAPQWR